MPGYKLLGNPQYPDMAADSARTFRLMKRLPCDIFLASHGSFYEMREKAELLARGRRPNPFIDARGYRSFVARTERAFREQLAQDRREAAGAGRRTRSPRAAGAR